MKQRELEVVKEFKPSKPSSGNILPLARPYLKNLPKPSNEDQSSNAGVYEGQFSLKPPQNGSISDCKLGKSFI